jgi:hypothetical protein
LSSLNPLILPAPYLDIDPAYSTPRFTQSVNTTRRSNHGSRFRLSWGPYLSLLAAASPSSPFLDYTPRLFSSLTSTQLLSFPLSSDLDFTGKLATPAPAYLTRGRTCSAHTPLASSLAHPARISSQAPVQACFHSTLALSLAPTLLLSPVSLFSRDVAAMPASLLTLLLTPSPYLFSFFTPTISSLPLVLWTHTPHPHLQARAAQAQTSTLH